MGDEIIQKKKILLLSDDMRMSTGIATMEQRNRIFVGDEIEIFGPGKDYFTQTIDNMWNHKGEEIDVAPHAQQIVKLKVKKEIDKYYLIRKRKED